MDANTVNAWGEPPAVVVNHSADSRRWQSIRLRAGDVVAASWAKSGTTWLQQVIVHMKYGIGGRYMLSRVAPWVESPYVSLDTLRRIEAPDSYPTRVFKTHLDAKAVPYSPTALYVFIARDGRDSIWSWYQHHQRLRPAVYEQMAAWVPAGVAPLLPPNPAFAPYFREWIEKDGYPLWPFWSHLKSWWELRERPNVLVLHYSDVIRNPGEQIVRLASFIGLALADEEVDRLLSVSSKEFMARNMAWIAPDLSLALKGGGGGFFKGVRRGWTELLSDEDVRLYQLTARKELGGELAAWLAQDAGAKLHGHERNR